ncbi:MAG TPA: NADH-quinone oxidoreductase subunit L [Fimbriimonadaceae bacterium]|nr:NADH-quinone oxidoreductase subunit L [Fimbriimonadaceae bacterium]
MDIELSSIWWVIGLPLIGFLIQALCGKIVVDALGPKLGKKIMGTLAVLPIAIAFIIGVLITVKLTGWDAGRRDFVLTLFDWITLKSLHVPFEVLIDPLSMTMVLIITGIGALIHLYATGYMSEEKEYTRFFCYLNLFIAFMLVLVLGNNLVMLFIGWEGVGLCSYLLIGFWYKDLANAKAANKAFIVNRIGDWGMTLGMFLLVAFMAGNLDKLAEPGPRWLSYDVIFPNAIALLKDSPGVATAIALLLFVGAMGKSAQFPLYIWLPDAMAGPTPVSALIHAATMVTAGVFLLNRVHVIFEASPVASAFVACIGAFTALFAALIAFGQTDIKKVLAYSTVSQLGFMFIGVGAGGYWTGMFHVTTHAFFKALLFLGAGAVIHAMAHNQDMRNYGRLIKYLPITGATMIVGWLAIAGIAIPYSGEGAYGFAGFYSKEMILGVALGGHFAEWQGQYVAVWAGWLGLFVALLTALYMTRMTWLTFFGKEERWRLAPAEGHAHHDEHAHAHDHHGHDAHGHDHGDDPHRFFYTDEELERRAQAEGHEHHHDLTPEHTPREVYPSMWFPLVVLAILSLIGGYVLYKGELFKNWLYPEGLSLLKPEMVHEHPAGVPLLWLSIAAGMGGVIAGIAWYFRGLPRAEGWDLSKWSVFRRSAGNQFGFDHAMVEAGVDGGGAMARGLWRVFDVGVIDGVVNGVARTTRGFGKLLRLLQTGFVRSYALLMLVGGVALLGYFLYLMNRGVGGP